ncbi:MAG TPA: VWA domain-containing protein [Chitinophagales bacterium]|nr:VWA domain-containing protein [Chitinophagales bacterium]HMU68661.1 VWA domain-containing protein [Chitinophagales bacterium]HMX03666.1 VWA domain-containing protein [Chitinophagales bacterium]HMZ87818.1 VWA domain-containing protein [Chitinophagales bacterium]HNE45630.1 VWA domain-containing protein [Chitinophagales bacterium]
MSFLSDIQFADPWFLLLLAGIPVYVYFRSKIERRKFVAMRMSTTSGIPKAPQGKAKFMSVLLILRLLAFALIVIAMARPQTSYSNSRMYSNGIDIMLALDVSPSMYAIDFKPNRMEAAKTAAKEFIDSRPNDRIGLVVFAGEAFTQCPSTLDHNLLKEQVDNADNYYLKDGTAIGDGLFMAVNRLADSTNISQKVIILLTDGVRVGGKFSPLDAANGAKELNMRVYTIGIGTNTNSPIPVFDKNGRHIFDLDPRISFDAPMLKNVASITGGSYFEADSKEKLTDIYQQIDKIEKTKFSMDISRRYDEHFYWFAVGGLICILLEVILSKTIFRTLT